MNGLSIVFVLGNFDNLVIILVVIGLVLIMILVVMNVCGVILIGIVVIMLVVILMGVVDIVLVDWYVNLLGNLFKELGIIFGAVFGVEGL